jgi:short-subunit dehydrogenase
VNVFAGKVVVVTGASQGIGHALVRELAAQAPRLVLASRDAARLETVAAECRALGAETLVVPTDVTEQAQCDALVDRTLERWGAVDVLVNNAGGTMMGRFEDFQDLAPYASVMRLNYLSAVFLTHRALPALRRARGLIVAVASLAGLTGVPTRTGYCASKHALIGFFDALRTELRGSGVGVSIVCPDFVVSQIHKRALGPDGRALGISPLREAKVMTAERCAALMVRAMAARRRLAILSLRGRLGRFVRLLAPELIDRIAVRAVREGR